MSRAERAWGAALLGALLFGGLAPTAAGDPRDASTAPLWKWSDPELQAGLDEEVAALGLMQAVRDGRLGIALVDLTEDDRWAVAMLNADQMFYAASLPKIAVMLAVFEKAEAGELVIDDQVRGQLERMIRHSSNPDTTALIHRVGKPAIAEILESPRYRLYEREGRGGLWVGKDYAAEGLWQRDPLANFSHAATPLQVARFYTLLHAGYLVSASASREMKALLADTAIHHKFVKGLKRTNPDAVIYRKSGTWREHHSDGALIEAGDVSYVAVGLASDPRGAQWLEQLIGRLDALVHERFRARAQKPRRWWRPRWPRFLPWSKQ